MNVLIINSSSYTQKMLKYFLSHYSPNVQAYEFDSAIPLDEVTPSPNLIFVNYEVNQKEKYESVLKQAASLAPVIMIHDDAESSLDESIRNYCANFIKRPINPANLQEIVNQVIPHTKDLKVTPYLEFAKDSDDPSLEPVSDNLETKEPLPISGALDGDLHTLLTDVKDITQLKDSTHLFKQFSEKKEEESNQNISPSETEEDKGIALSSVDEQVPSSDKPKTETPPEVNIVVTPPATSVETKVTSENKESPIKESPITLESSENKQSKKVNIVVTPPTTPIETKVTSENKEKNSIPLESSKESSINVIVTPPPNATQSEKKDSKPNIPPADSTHHITFTQQSAPPQNTPSQNTPPQSAPPQSIKTDSKEEIYHIIDQKIQSKWDDFIEKKIQTTLHDMVAKKTEPPEPKKELKMDEETLNFIDHKINERWNELFENKIKKELEELIHLAITKIFKEQLKEILTSKGVQSIREISLDIIPEISRQIVKKEIQKLIQQSSQTKN